MTALEIAEASDTSRERVQVFVAITRNGTVVGFCM